MGQTPTATTVATYLVARLADLGAEHLFAVPGDYVAAFLDAVDGSKRMRRVAAVNELEAGYAADGYARYRGIAAMAVTYGVGAFSALNAVAGSYVERLPVVAINGSPSHTNRRFGNDRGILFHHSTGDVDANIDIFRRVTVAAEVIASGIEAPEQIDRALRAAITHHRPVYIEVLKDIWNAACTAPFGSIVAERWGSDPVQLAEAVSTAWSILERAERGIIWAGIELHRMRLEPLLEDLLAASGWPFATTLLAKSLLSENNRHFAGVYAGPASLDTTRKAIEGADAILALGTLITDDYLDLLADPYKPMIVAFDGAVRVGLRVFPQVRLERFSEALLNRFHGSGKKPQRLRPAGPAQARHVASSRRIGFSSLFRELEDFLDPKMVLVVDESDSMYVSASMRIPTRGGFVSQAAWGSIGYAAAGAIGVGIASGRRPVVVTGDGGFQMTCQALSTLQREQLGAIVLIVDNEIYGIEQALVDLGPFGTPPTDFRRYNELPRWDYVKLAESMGAVGIHARTVAGLRSALERAKARKEDLTVIVVRIPKADLPDAIRALASDTGFPRYPCPDEAAEMLLALLRARTGRIMR